MKFVKIGVSYGGIMIVILLYFGCMYVCANIYGSIDMIDKSLINIVMVNYMKLYKCYISIYVICEVLEFCRFEKFWKNENVKNDNFCKFVFVEK